MFKNKSSRMLQIVIFICTLIIVLFAILAGMYSTKAFQYKTYINGIECSFLNIESTIDKLERKMNNAKLTLIFANNKQYTCLGTYFDIKVKNKKEIENTLFKQKEEDTNTQKTYNITELYSINEPKVKEYISSLSVFQSEMNDPENAYLEYDGKNSVIIKEEKYGNKIDVEAAYNFMISELKKGETVIDFRKITNIEPKIKASDENLISQRDYINSILKTTITYKLYDGNTYKLDANVMKDWIYKDDDENYGIDLEKNITKFVENLNKKATYLLTSTKFNATGKGEISISFGRKTYATVNKDKEIERIKEQLKKCESTEFEVTYNPFPDYKNIKTYVELDLSRQRVWMYVNGKCILNTPCVTGNVAGGYATPPGIYYLTYKTTNTTLEGYNSDGSKYASPVTFWMPFNGGIGFHDASWRSYFGGNIYMTNGSHGCVNLPYSAAKTLYNNINTSVPIILY